MRRSSAAAATLRHSHASAAVEPTPSDRLEIAFGRPSTPVLRARAAAAKREARRDAPARSWRHREERLPDPAHMRRSQHAIAARREPAQSRAAARAGLGRRARSTGHERCPRHLGRRGSFKLRDIKQIPRTAASPRAELRTWAAAERPIPGRRAASAPADRVVRPDGARAPQRRVPLRHGCWSTARTLDAANFAAPAFSRLRRRRTRTTGFGETGDPRARVASAQAAVPGAAARIQETPAGGREGDGGAARRRPRRQRLGEGPSRSECRTAARRSIPARLEARRRGAARLQSSARFPMTATGRLGTTWARAQVAACGDHPARRIERLPHAVIASRSAARMKTRWSRPARAALAGSPPWRASMSATWSSWARLAPAKFAPRRRGSALATASNVYKNCRVDRRRRRCAPRARAAVAARGSCAASGDSPLQRSRAPAVDDRRQPSLPAVIGDRRRGRGRRCGEIVASRRARHLARHAAACRSTRRGRRRPPGSTTTARAARRLRSTAGRRRGKSLGFARDAAAAGSRRRPVGQGVGSVEAAIDEAEPRRRAPSAGRPLRTRAPFGSRRRRNAARRAPLRRGAREQRQPSAASRASRRSRDALAAFCDACSPRARAAGDRRDVPAAMRRRRCASPTQRDRRGRRRRRCRCDNALRHRQRPSGVGARRRGDKARSSRRDGDRHASGSPHFAPARPRRPSRSPSRSTRRAEAGRRGGGWVRARRRGGHARDAAVVPRFRRSSRRVCSRRRGPDEGIGAPRCRASPRRGSRRSSARAHGRRARRRRRDGYRPQPRGRRGSLRDAERRLTRDRQRRAAGERRASGATARRRRRLRDGRARSRRRTAPLARPRR